MLVFAVSTNMFLLMLLLLLLMLLLLKLVRVTEIFKTQNLFSGVASVVFNENPSTTLPKLSLITFF